MRSSRGRLAARTSLALLMAFAAAAAEAGEDRAVESRAAYLEELLAGARSSGLAAGRAWHALVHYEENRVGSSFTSLADGRRFFLAPDGRRDPGAELEATLRAFVEPETHPSSDGGDPRCAFPARYRVLDAALHFDSTRMPSPATCESYDRWIGGMRPAGLTLVFPEAYMNNPASMFGHTLLRVDATDQTQGGHLLDYAVNFAAETGSDGGVAFAWKGITGFYSGYFSVLPYYEKLKQYGDWENRDIWEYPLDFTQDETMLVLAHVWELEHVSFPYYFFDDNCSYQLLALLEVARPELRLTEDFPLWVIPVDTVKTVAAQPGLVRSASWRPSPATRLRKTGALLSGDESRLARDVSAGRLRADAAEVQSLAPARRAVVLTQAYDDLRYRYFAGKVSTEESRPRSLEILRAVSATGLDVTTPEPEPPRRRPEQGHPSARIALAGGSRDGDAFVELRLRPAFHELSDPLGGYTRGAQITILDTALRWYPEHERVRVEEVTLVDVTSITSRDAFLRPVSFSFRTGARTRLLPDASDHLDPELTWGTRGGAGLAWELWQGAVGFGFLDAAADVAPALHHDVAVGPGATLGVLAGDTADRTRTLFTARATGYLLGDTTESYRIGLEEGISISQRTAVVLDVAWEHAYGEDWLDATVSFKWFFRRRWAGS